MLREHLGQDLGGVAHRIKLALSGHAQDMARLEAIDILRDKGIGVGPQQGQHHLIDADLGGRARGVGNAPQGVGGADRTVIAATVIGPVAVRVAAGGRPRLRTARRGAGRGRAEFGGALSRIIERRVEQDGVFTKEAAI